ncbi:MAG: hypothetical protein ACLTT1_19805 [[Clostridium] scindens]
MPSIIHLLIRYISLRACALCTFTEIPFLKHACSGISLSPLSDAVPARFRFATSRCGLAPYAPLQKSPFSSKALLGDFSFSAAGRRASSIPLRFFSLRARALCTFTEIPFLKQACSGISLSPLSDAVPARFRFASSRCGLAPYAPLQKSPFSSKLARGFL